MINLLVGTKNRGKAAEIARLLAGLPVRVMGLTDMPEEVRSAPEEGGDFLKNAETKALHYAGETGLLCVADDSGLCVDALGGAPGVRSARYAGPEQSDAANINKLLTALKGVPATRRNAYFVCAVSLAEPERSVFTLASSCYGRIAETPRGDGGFGYDPVFIPEDSRLTFAQMDAEKKDAISHRGRAFRAFARELKKYLVRRGLI